MRVVRAERWHHVRGSHGTSGPRRCSVCGSAQLTAAGEVVLDARTSQRYRVVRCHDCGYDLLEALGLLLSVAS
ncbi:MAG: hypothetical protein IRZ14_04960 [Chloroflexi bacterium]|nr:hypothetical protein [Chloroflexota bacterium]